MARLEWNRIGSLTVDNREKKGEALVERHRQNWRFEGEEIEWDGEERRRRTNERKGANEEAQRIEAGQARRMRIRVVSQANDEQRAALSGDPAIRNAVSSGDEHFYFYPRSFGLLLVALFAFSPLSWGKSRKESGRCMHSDVVVDRSTNSRACPFFSLPASPLINLLLRMFIRDVKSFPETSSRPSLFRKTLHVLTGRTNKLHPPITGGSNPLENATPGISISDTSSSDSFCVLQRNSSLIPTKRSISWIPITTYRMHSNFSFPQTFYKKHSIFIWINFP